MLHGNVTLHGNVPLYSNVPLHCNVPLYIPGSVHFAFKHPVASCVMTYIVASSGGILANLMVGAPPLECVVNGWNVFVAVLSW